MANVSFILRPSFTKTCIQIIDRFVDILRGATHGGRDPPDPLCHYVSGFQTIFFELFYTVERLVVPWFERVANYLRLFGRRASSRAQQSTSIASEDATHPLVLWTTLTVRSTTPRRGNETILR